MRRRRFRADRGVTSNDLSCEATATAAAAAVASAAVRQVYSVLKSALLSDSAPHRATYCGCKSQRRDAAPAAAAAAAAAAAVINFNFAPVSASQ